MPRQEAKETTMSNQHTLADTTQREWLRDRHQLIQQVTTGSDRNGTAVVIITWRTSGHGSLERLPERLNGTRLEELTL
jgi:hypothetical protein